MNQLQIGKFIQECRKEKGLTQQELAEKFGISNRAISKWETGNSMPDISIILELCNTLGINANELLCGKKLDEKQYKIENEKTVLSLIDVKENLRTLKFCSIILTFVGFLMIISFMQLLAVTLFDKILTFTVGGFVLGYGVWLRLKILEISKK